MANETMVELDGIYKNFGGVNVLEDFSAQIKKEEIVCVIGPSGCGKSTLLNIISGILKPSEGRIACLSENISYVFQEDRLLPWKDVYQNIKIVNKSCSHEKCMKLIKQVGLDGFEGFFPSELSGGMRQRCSIARAFNYEADLMLMDEPFKALDYTLKIGMIKYLLELWQDMKKTIIFVTHEIDEAMLTGDRILLLSDRPSKILKEFIIQEDKLKRDLTTPEFVTIRNSIIGSL